MRTDYEHRIHTTIHCMVNKHGLQHRIADVLTNKIEIKTYEHGSNDTRMPVHRRAGREEGIHLHQWETLAMELLLVERKGRKKASPPHVPEGTLPLHQIRTV